jgi:hypothetical protein
MRNHQCLDLPNLDFIFRNNMDDDFHGRLTIQSRDPHGESIELAMALSVRIDSETFMRNIKEWRWKIVSMARTNKIIYFLILRDSQDAGLTKRMERVGLCWISSGILQEFTLFSTVIFCQHGSDVYIV